MTKTIAGTLFLVASSLSAFASDPVVDQKLAEIADVRSTFQAAIAPNLELMTKVDVYRVLEAKNKKSELKAMRTELCDQSQETVRQLNSFIPALETLSGNSLRMAGYPTEAKLINKFKLNAAKMLKNIADTNYEFTKEVCFFDKPDSGKLSVLSFELNSIGFLTQIDLLTHQIESNIL